jgi:hypothetical protein
MLKNSPTYIAQAGLANYCRNGNTHSLKGVREDNLPQYRRLIRNIFNDTLVTAYPITGKLLSDNEWNGLVDDFMRDFSPSSPQVWQMPRELWEYVSDSGHHLAVKYPFLTDLLWFEWLEIELYMMKDITVSFRQKGSLREEKMVLNPEHKIVGFEWPVFLKSPGKIESDDKGQYFLVMFRHPVNKSVRFIHVSPVLARLIELLSENPKSLEELIADLSIDLKATISSEQQSYVEIFLSGLFEKGLLLGYADSKDW